LTTCNHLGADQSAKSTTPISPTDPSTIQIGHLYLLT